ncbi:MAG: dihydroorotase [Candidatus Nanopelagicaceae bacterium]
MRETFRFVNARLATGEKTSITIENGVIASIGGNVTTPAQEIDLKGMLVTPSFVDLHTHLREPGKEDAETVASGTRAAVRGGFGAIFAMPNTNPVADTAGVVEQVHSLGVEEGRCDVIPIGAVTRGQEGKQLAEILAMAHSRASVRVFSDDGHCVSDSLLMRRALEYVKIFDGVIAQHAQDPELTKDAQMNEGVISSRLGLKGWPAVAEEAVIARDVLLADHVGSRLHICHLSTAGSVEIVRWAKARGIQVTAEVTPHHLLLTDELASTFDPVYKVNPPLRTERDVHALRDGVADGTIDIIATDHAPHPLESKECEWPAAAFGMIGLESAFSIAYHSLVKSGSLSLQALVAAMTTKPAAIGALSDRMNGLTVGAPASLAVIDLDKEWVIDRAKVESKSSNTPFHGFEVVGSVESVLYQGEWVMRDGVITV